MIDGQGIGVVRVSFGFGSQEEDVDVLERFLERCFVRPTSSIGLGDGQVEEMKVERIVVFPVKGLCGMDVTEWQVDDEGLRFDRLCFVVEIGTKLRSLSPKM